MPESQVAIIVYDWVVIHGTVSRGLVAHVTTTGSPRPRLTASQVKTCMCFARFAHHRRHRSWGSRGRCSSELSHVNVAALQKGCQAFMHTGRVFAWIAADMHVYEM